MNKTGLILGAVIAIAAVAGAVVYLTHPYRAPQQAPTEHGTGNAAVGASGASAVITYSDQGFSPSPLTIALGTTVTWVNQSSRTMWVEGAGSSGDDCANAQARALLNECRAVVAGGSYSYTFARLGTVSYVNHDSSADTGIVIVTDASSSGPINPNAIPE